MLKATIGFIALATTLAVAGCASETLEEEVDDVEGASTRGVSLKYEGTCEFLRNCSSYSRGLPRGQVTWGCTGVGACDDDALWVAGPTRSYCGKTVRICKGQRCTNALVKDVSVTRDWEASNGVLSALGLPYGLTGRCSGYGGGQVTVTVGGSSSTPPPSRSTSNDDDCWSATLNDDVAELTCVQSRSNRVWYQCKEGQWYRGVQGSEGPYGPCAATHPL